MINQLVKSDYYPGLNSTPRLIYSALLNTVYSQIKALGTMEAYTASATVKTQVPKLDFLEDLAEQDTCIKAICPFLHDWPRP